MINKERIAHILFYSTIIVIGIRTGYMFFDNQSRIGGIVMSICSLILGAHGLRENIEKYKQAKNEFDDHEAGSRLFSISQSLGLIFCGIVAPIFIIIYWIKLQP